MGDDVGRSEPDRKAAVAGGLALGWSSVLIVVALFLLLANPMMIRVSESGYCENDDHPGPCADALELFGPALVAVPAAVWCHAASLGFRRGRRWARPAVVATFGLLAIGALGLLGTELARDEPSRPDAVLASLGLLAWFATTAVLAAAAQPGQSDQPDRSP